MSGQDRKPTAFPFFLASAGKPSMLSSWQAYKNQMAKGFIPVMIGRLRNFDIDDQLDFKIATAVFENVFIGRKNKG